MSQNSFDTMDTSTNDKSHCTTVGIIFVATNRYKRFALRALREFDQLFLPETRKVFYVFTDSPEYFSALKLNNQNHYFKIPAYRFPDATLRRYEFISSIASLLQEQCNYLFYSDVDMEIETEILEEEVLHQALVVTAHPGFFRSQGGTYETNPNSKAFLSEPKLPYVAGGFQGGECRRFLELSRDLDLRIKDDREAGITAVWHDESHLNWYINSHSLDLEVLSPAYCHCRTLPGMREIQPKITVIRKNHNFHRSLSLSQHLQNILHSVLPNSQ